MLFTTTRFAQCSKTKRLSHFHDGTYEQDKRNKNLIVKNISKIQNNYLIMRIGSNAKGILKICRHLMPLLSRKRALIKDQLTLKTYYPIACERAAVLKQKFFTVLWIQAADTAQRLMQ